MMAKKNRIIEVAIGLSMAVFVAWAMKNHFEPVEAASLRFYDLIHDLRTASADKAPIAIVEIDENSVKNLGRWPWPRSVQAQLISDIANSGAKVIGLNIGYWDADQTEGADKIAEIQQTYAALLQAQKPLLKKGKIKLAPFEQFLDFLKQTKEDLNADVQLGKAIEEASSVILPMYFQPGKPVENLEPIPPTFAAEKGVNPNTPDFPNLQPTLAAALPLNEFAKAALRVGHCNLLTDIDGSIRRIAPFMRYGDLLYPSLAVQIMREYRSVQDDALSYTFTNGFRFAKMNVPVDEDGEAFIEFAGPAGSFKSYSAIDVLSSALQPDTFDKKIVLVGVTTTGGAENFVVPGGKRMTGLEIWANHLQNLLTQTFVSRPPWARKAEWGMVLLAALVLMGALPFLKARFSVPIAGLVMAGFLGFSINSYSSKGLWVSPMYGVILLGGGFLLLMSKRLLLTERGKEMVEFESVETNKMLGLSFQGQGMLDIAFEKFRKCPMDSSMKELLYNLGLDMERKRQFSKAAAVYEHIAANDSKFKDIKDKIELLKKAGDGLLVGTLGKKGNESTIVVSGLGQNTTLGRYEVIKELGRGAMGIVYLGRDPKINRQVAIKTLRFEDETDGEQTKATKERFFREAESAGNLTHPNIIRIFDAGEDQDVAYIAMELLEGTDLKKYCEKSNLLPIATVLDYTALIAEALDYAHKQGVVHRDIKPGNIMLIKDQTLRITDFGIARIQATSKTATGAVLGTPAYMSPEQVNGKKVDGRADLFSLGVTMYELLTGEKPFQADTIAALLFRIANVEPTNPLEYNPQIPAAIVPVIHKALAKNAENRYQTGQEFADAIRQAMTTPTEAPVPAASAPQAPHNEGTLGAPKPPQTGTVTIEPTAHGPSFASRETPAAKETPKSDADITATLTSDLAKTFNLKMTDIAGDTVVQPPISVDPRIESTNPFVNKTNDVSPPQGGAV